MTRDRAEALGGEITLEAVARKIVLEANWETVEAAEIFVAASAGDAESDVGVGETEAAREESKGYGTIYRWRGCRQKGW